MECKEKTRFAKDTMATRLTAWEKGQEWPKRKEKQTVLEHQLHAGEFEGQENEEQKVTKVPTKNPKEEREPGMTLRVVLLLS